MILGRVRGAGKGQWCLVGSVMLRYVSDARKSERHAASRNSPVVMLLLCQPYKLVGSECIHLDSLKEHVFSLMGTNSS